VSGLRAPASASRASRREGEAGSGWSVPSRAEPASAARVLDDSAIGEPSLNFVFGGGSGA
jgi:hypothetical protein